MQTLPVHTADNRYRDRNIQVGICQMNTAIIPAPMEPASIHIEHEPELISEEIIFHHLFLVQPEEIPFRFQSKKRIPPAASADAYAVFGHPHRVIYQYFHLLRDKFYPLLLIRLQQELLHVLLVSRYSG